MTVSQLQSLNLKDNLTLRATHDCKLKMVKKEVKLPGPGQALVHVKATGICGSDVHFWKHGCLGPWKIETEVSIGHESGGIVIAIGEGVENVQVGDKVAIEPGVPCGMATCDFCLNGEYNLCPTVDFYSVPPMDGTLTRYHLHPAAWLHKVPDTFTYDQIALLEPLSVSLRALERAEVTLGQPCLVTGAGPIGIITLAVLNAAGASPIVITDISPERLAFAKKLVPSVETYQVNTKMSPTESAAEILKVFGKFKKGMMPEVVMECTGVESSVNTACYATKPTGLVFVIGVGNPIQSIPFMHLSTNEIDLKFLFRYRHTWPRAIRLIQSGVLDLRSLVTHVFPLEKAQEAVESSANRDIFSIKTMIIDEED
ncbi:chaperonin 10-like protein [Powellomyces hirtus]|nr:chaperonin 10-like protein [Powellomyces hirtus]